MLKRAPTLCIRVRGSVPSVPPPPPSSPSAGGGASILASLRQKMAASDMEGRKVQAVLGTLPSDSAPTTTTTPDYSLLQPHLMRRQGTTVEDARSPHNVPRSRMLASMDEIGAVEKEGLQWRRIRQDAAEREVFRGVAAAASVGGGGGRIKGASSPSAKSYASIMPQLSIMGGSRGSRVSPSVITKRVLECWVEALRAQGPVPQGPVPPPSTNDNDQLTAILEEERLYMAALELLLSGGPFPTATSIAPLNEEELRSALSLGLIDMECVAKALLIDGEEAHVVATTEGGREEGDVGGGCSVRDAVLPEDTLGALQMSEHVCRWIREVHASKCMGLPNDHISSLYLRAEMAKKDESNRSRAVGSKTQAAANVREFSAEDIALLEEYEKSKLGAPPSPSGGATGGSGSSSSTSAMLSDTNPVLRRAASLDSGLEESMRVMDRVRQSALLDGDFQEALAYTNALYERDFQRASDLYSMRAYTDDELRELEVGRQVSGKSLSQESKKELEGRLSAIRRKKADKEMDGGGGESGQREGQNRPSRAAEPWREARDKHRISVAKAMRVMNPDSALRPDGGAADMPYFVGPSGGRSFPPPSASFNVPTPSPTKYGRRAPRYKGDKSGGDIHTR